MQTNKPTIIFFIIILLVFSAGIFKLFSLRFEAGDIYPPYSSLRSDPLGSKALYESYKATGSLDVERNFLPLSKIKNEDRTLLFFLGDTPNTIDFIPLNLYETVTDFLSSGGRLVIAFSPMSKKSYSKKKVEGNTDKTEVDCGDQEKAESEDITEDTTEKQGTTSDSDNTEEMKMISLSEKWGFSFNYEVDDSALKMKAFSSLNELEQTISWHSIMSYNDLSPEWQVIYQVNGKPVIIERSVSAGSVVFCSDSYFASNEALLNERSPRFLSWIAGSSNKIIFDESHFGIQKNPGIANLIRKYDLHGFTIALIVFAILFIWKNASYFVPPPETKEIYSGDQVSSRDNSSGLASLLRKNIGKRQIIDVCINEWKKSFVSNNEASRKNAETLKKIQLMVNSGEETSQDKKDPVKVYVKVCRILSEGRKI